MCAKRVLIITYYFPPRPGVASLRLRGLAKYLPEFGWEPVILTAALPSTPDPRFQVIQTPYPGDVSALLKKRLHLQPASGFQEQIGIPLAIRGSKHSISGQLTQFAKGFIVYPDEQKYWLPFGIKAGHKLLQKEKFDALLSSFGPVTCHLIAKDLKIRFGIPWGADFRDLWTQDHYYPYSGLRKWIEKKLETKTLDWADAIVTVSRPDAEKMRALHQGKPVFTIPNGFDPDEVSTAPLTKEFTITYTGQLYQGKRDPKLLLKALHELIAEGTIDSSNIKVRFFGPAEYWLEREIKRYHLEGVVEQYGTVPREIVLDKQRESHILLLLNWDNPREVGVYTGKVFEYLAAKRLVLAIGGPRGVVAELLEGTGAGVHISKLPGLKNFLTQAYKYYAATGGTLYNGNDTEIRKYSHREMARKFAEVLTNILDLPRFSGRVKGSAARRGLERWR